MVVPVKKAQSQFVPEAAETLAPETFGPNSQLQTNRGARTLDVIRTLDFDTEVERAKALAQSEDLVSVKLRLNGIEIAVHCEQQIEAARAAYLIVSGKRRKSGFDITNRGSGMLEDRVYSAVLAARLLEPECEYVVFDFNEPGMLRYGPTVVTRNSDPEEVVAELVNGRRR